MHGDRQESNFILLLMGIHLSFLKMKWLQLYVLMCGSLLCPIDCCHVCFYVSIIGCGYCCSLRFFFFLTQLKIWNDNSPLLCYFCFWLSGPFVLPDEFWGSFPLISMKNELGVLIRIALNLKRASGRVVTSIILSVHLHCISCHSS